MSNNKMKGLLKGLRYISNMFENEKDSEMEIGFPTDVKHVAHIGWDGPSVNSPSWMTEFKSPPEYSSAPLERGGEKDGSSVTWASEDSSTKSARVAENVSAQDVPIPKTSRRNASTGSTDENCIKDKSEKSKRRSSKNSSKEMSDPTKSKNPSKEMSVPTKSKNPSKEMSVHTKSRNPSKEIADPSKAKDASQESESPSKSSEATKKSRRKKSVDGSTKASRSARRVRGSKTEIVSEAGLISKDNNLNNDELSQTSGFNPTEGGEENDKGFKEVS